MWDTELNEDSKYADILPYEGDVLPTTYDNSGYYGLAEDNEKWNREFDQRRALETVGVSKGVRSNTRASSGAYAYGEKIAPLTIGSLPKLEVDPFVAPQRDKNRISSLTAQHSGASIRDVKQLKRQAIATSSSLPMAERRLSLKQAIQGYGGALSKIMDSARQTALAQYDREYANEYNEAATNYRTGVEFARIQNENRIKRLIYNAQNPQAGNRIISDTDYDYRG